MASCSKCGGEIIFRNVGGAPMPIHLSGGCGGGGSGSRWSAKQFASTASFVDPNARCPVCGEVVFYYQSPFGGRVFFDALGWPWPKHPCTDNPCSQTGPVTLRTQSVDRIFKSKDGEVLRVYLLDKDKFLPDGLLYLRFRNTESNAVFQTKIVMSSLEAIDITLDDLKNAPSFVVRKKEGYRLIEFISARKKEIDHFKLIATG